MGGHTRRPFPELGWLALVPPPPPRQQPRFSPGLDRVRVEEAPEEPRRLRATRGRGKAAALPQVGEGHHGKGLLAAAAEGAEPGAAGRTGAPLPLQGGDRSGAAVPQSNPG